MKPITKDQKAIANCEARIKKAKEKEKAARDKVAALEKELANWKNAKEKK